jgi:hypothetical protein
VLRGDNIFLVPDSADESPADQRLRSRRQANQQITTAQSAKIERSKANLKFGGFATLSGPPPSETKQVINNSHKRISASIVPKHENEKFGYPQASKVGGPRIGKSAFWTNSKLQANMAGGNNSAEEQEVAVEEINTGSGQVTENEKIIQEDAVEVVEKPKFHDLDSSPPTRQHVMDTSIRKVNVFLTRHPIPSTSNPGRSTSPESTGEAAGDKGDQSDVDDVADNADEDEVQPIENSLVGPVMRADVLQAWPTG